MSSDPTPQPNYWLIAFFALLLLAFFGGVVYAIFRSFTNGHFSGTMGGS